MRAGWHVRVASLAAVALVAAACGGDGDGADDADPASSSDAAGSAAPDDLQIGAGITEEPCPSDHPETANADNGCIYLGVLSSLTEPPYAAVAEQILAGQVAFWREVNSAGGIGGYDVDITEYTRDNRGDPQVHAEQYREIEPNVLALAQAFGVEATTGIIDRMRADDMLAVPATSWSGWTFEELTLPSGTSTCLQAISGLDYAADDWVSSEIDAITVVAFAGPDGNDAAAGATAWAGAAGVAVDVVVTGPNIVVGDQSGPVRRIIERDPTVVVLAVGPTEAAEIIVDTDAGGHNGVFLGLGTTWSPALGTSDDADLFDVVYRNLSAWEPLGADTPAHRAMAAALGEQSAAGDAFVRGWVSAYPLRAALEAAVDAGALTRAALRDAATSMQVDYQGALSAVSFRDGLAGLRSVVVSEPDSSAPTGLKTVRDAYTGATAESFAFDGACEQG